MAGVCRTGGDIEVRDGQQRTAMHLAAMHGQTAVLQQLAAAGADPSPLDQDHKTPLHLAVEAGREEAAAALVAVGGVVDPTAAAKCKLLHAAVGQGQLQMLKLLIVAGAAVQIEAAQPEETPLHVAASEGSVEAINLLVRAGVRLDARDPSGATPPHIAAGIRSLPAVRALLRVGSDANALDNDMQTALHHAVTWTQKHGYIPTKVILQTLLAAGANVGMVNREGNTAVQIAVSPPFSAESAAELLLGGASFAGVPYMPAGTSLPRIRGILHPEHDNLAASLQQHKRIRSNLARLLLRSGQATSFKRPAGSLEGAFQHTGMYLPPVSVPDYSRFPVWFPREMAGLVCDTARLRVEVAAVSIVTPRMQEAIVKVVQAYVQEREREAGAPEDVLMES